MNSGNKHITEVQNPSPGVVHFLYEDHEWSAHATAIKVWDSWNIVGYECDEFTDDENSELFDRIAYQVERSTIPQILGDPQ